MTDTTALAFKNALLQHCITLINQRIQSSISGMENAQDSANNESKSSAGDKYETGRAMGHLEKEMHAKQLAANRTDLALLLTVSCGKIYHSGSTGALIQCEGLSFFIASGLGKIVFEGDIIYLVSPNAPMAKVLQFKKQGDSITFNKKEIRILAVY